MIVGGKQRKILFVTSGNCSNASSRIRVLNYFSYFEKNGWKVKWIPRIPNEKLGFLNKVIKAVLKRFFLLKKYYKLLFSKYNVVCFQRTGIDSWLLWLLRIRNTQIIFDIDDGIFLSGKKYNNLVCNMISKSHCVICGSFELKKYISKRTASPVHVIYSPVNVHLLKPKKIVSEKMLTIGWIGSSWTDKYLDEVLPIIDKLQIENFRFLIIGSSKEFNNLNHDIKYLPWLLERESEYLNMMDIGIMPLDDSEWSKYKGGYKLFQYFATGIPVVASPVGINVDIVEEGVNGFLPSCRDRWASDIKRLILDDGLRYRMGKNARLKAEKEYSYENNFNRLSKVLKYG